MVKKEEDRNQHYLTQECWIRAHVGAKRYLSNKVTNVSLNCVWKRHSGVFIVGPPGVWKEVITTHDTANPPLGQDTRIFGISRFI